MSVAELSDRRNQRAAEQAAEYDLRLTSVNGAAVVYVISHHADSHGNQPIYSVHSDGRCNCPDYLHRCAAAGIKCKHGVMVEQFMADGLTGEEAVPAEAPVQECGGCGEPKEGRLCSGCGSSAIVRGEPVVTPDLSAVLRPEEAARIQTLRHRYAADVKRGLWD